MEWKVTRISSLHPALNFFMNAILILWCRSDVFVLCYTFKSFITILKLRHFILSALKETCRPMYIGSSSF
jgi:hypothetical protein